MNNRMEQTNDILREYINPEVIERAPECFTSNVMRGVQSELLPLKKKGILSGRIIVPVISGVLVVLFILAIVLLPGSKERSLVSPAYDFINSLKISMPSIDFNSLLKFSIPVTLAYAVIGILILSLFDRALNQLFHREKQL
jgi:hypothetical protein